MFYDRLDYICKEKNTTITAVVVAIGLSKGNIKNWKNGSIPKYETRLKIAKHLDIPIEKLMTEREIDEKNKLNDSFQNISRFVSTKVELDDIRNFMIEHASQSSGEELSNDTISNIEIELIQKYRTLDGYGKKAVDFILDNEYQRCTEVTDEPKVITLPMAELKASAGTGQWLGDDEYTTWVDVLDTPEARRANVVIEVSGDSMLPDYHNGDKVLVKLQPTVEQNEIGIFIVDNCGYIKKLGVNELISVNEEFGNIPINEYNDVTCVGKVIGIADVVI